MENRLEHYTNIHLLVYSLIYIYIFFQYFVKYRMNISIARSYTALAMPDKSLNCTGTTKLWNVWGGGHDNIKISNTMTKRTYKTAVLDISEAVTSYNVTKIFSGHFIMIALQFYGNKWTLYVNIFFNLMTNMLLLARNYCINHWFNRFG